MVSPYITPEKGVDIYERDYTQGPACAIACGAGTIYRNYFAPVNGEQGQSNYNQIDCLELIGKELNNEELLLWKMSNGYALLSHDGLLNINTQIHKKSQEQREQLKENLKIGIQWKTEVTLANSTQIVSQIYCSALPVSYSQIKSSHWEIFSKVILEATYEATLYAALINLDQTGCNKVFLTLVGGGAFGNEIDWIMDALRTSLLKFKDMPLDINIVSYNSSSPKIQELITQFNNEVI